MFHKNTASQAALTILSSIATSSPFVGMDVIDCSVLALFARLAGFHSFDGDFQK
jgi:hypothetical protein